MFTGIVEGQRAVVDASVRSGSLALRIRLDDLALGVRVGDSISVRGCCLTVTGVEGGVASFHLMGETLGLTLFATAKSGDLVNVERSLRVGDRLGGHFVSGHVDGIGAIAAVVARDGQTDLTVKLPPAISALVIPKGSIAIDGVSVTITAIDGPLVSVSLIPHTLEVTTLGRLVRGDGVHLEMDMIGKWVQRLLPS